MNPNDDRDTEVDQKDIDAGNKASKRNEAKRRLVAEHGEGILEDSGLEQKITDEVERMKRAVEGEQPLVKGHNPDSERTGATLAENSQNPDVAKGAAVPPDSAKRVPSKVNKTQ